MADEQRPFVETLQEMGTIFACIGGTLAVLSQLLHERSAVACKPKASKKDIKGAIRGRSASKSKDKSKPPVATATDINTRSTWLACADTPLGKSKRATERWFLGYGVFWILCFGAIVGFGMYEWFDKQHYIIVCGGTWERPKF